MAESIWPRDLGVICIAVYIYCAQCVVTIVIHCKKKVSDFPVPSRCREIANLFYSVCFLKVSQYTLLKSSARVQQEPEVFSNIFYVGSKKTPDLGRGENIFVLPGIKFINTFVTQLIKI
jgi:hypothetical protein